MSDYINESALASNAYHVIKNKATTNKWMQGISGGLGFPFTTIVDVGVIATHYVPMFNQIRKIYGRAPLESGNIIPLVKNISKELVADIIVDKVMGNIPIVGIPLNIMCAKAMTWRLGILFAMLSSRGNEIDSNKVGDAVKVIRNMFPKSAFGFPAPNEGLFVHLVNSVYDISQDAYDRKIEAAKEAFENA
jgi:hypothetical protein